MKSTGLGALALAAGVAIGCGGNTANDRDDAGLRDDRGSVGTSGALDDDDRDQDRFSFGPGAPRDLREFVEEVSTVNHSELMLARLAVERAQGSDVKQFAQMLIRDHTNAGNELEQAVSSHNVTIATAMDDKHQASYDRLKNLRGAEFDREFMKTMVDGHKNATKLIGNKADDRTRATGTSGAQANRPEDHDEALDAAVSQWAAGTLPTIERHLERAEQIPRGTSGSQSRTTPGSHHRDAGAQSPSKPKY